MISKEHYDFLKFIPNTYTPEQFKKLSKSSQISYIRGINEYNKKCDEFDVPERKISLLELNK